MQRRKETSSMQDRIMGMAARHESFDISHKAHDNVGITIVALLKQFAKEKDLYRGAQIHADVVKKGLLVKNIYVGNSLINMYAKCGDLLKAKEVFDEMQFRTAVSWSTLIAGYANYGFGEQAIGLFEQMQLDGFSPTPVTFACILKACGIMREINKGQEVHSMVLKDGLLQRNIIVGNALIDMYAKCGLLDKAQEVFDQLPTLDVISWTALISGYTLHEHADEALICFSQMQRKGYAPNEVTFACALKACGLLGVADKGKDIHATIVGDKLLGKNTILGNALTDMYAKCGLFEKARMVFETLPARDVVSWNVLISGHMQHGHAAMALKYFEQMHREFVCPDATTYSSVLKACGSIGSVDKGQEMHLVIIRHGLIGEVTIITALVDMYMKCGALTKAQEVFDAVLHRDIVSWSVLITGYVNHGHNEDALKYFDKMQREGFSPDEVTFICVLKACGSVGAAERGYEVHANIVKTGSLIGNALIDMYGNFGMLEEAQYVFDKLQVYDLISWTTLISGFAQLGMDNIVFEMFDKMIEQGKEPDKITLTLVLNTCNHSGLLDIGHMYFHTMNTYYSIVPTLEHHTCIVDLLGRVGQIEKAMVFIEEMPFFDTLTMWHTVLGACHKWANTKLGRLAFENALQLDGKDAAAYVCMSNIYAACGLHEDAEKVEALRIQNGAWNS